MNAVDQLRGELSKAAGPWDFLTSFGISGSLGMKAVAMVPRTIDRILDGDLSTLAALRDVLGPREPWWYGTPLGRLVAPHWLGESVPVGVAAKMLCVGPSRIQQLLSEGKVTRVDGGVSVRSILDRMEWLDGRETQ